MLFILSESIQAASWEYPMESRGERDRLFFDARHTLDEIEIPTWRLCLSFQEGQSASSAEDVPKMWTLRSNS